jgi:catechol 2,3-dioxygenase-like lactoylglutathione lyase family enzyme
MASVRYIVAEVDKAVAFYRDNLDFKIDKHNHGKFAALVRDESSISGFPRRHKQRSRRQVRDGQKPSLWTSCPNSDTRIGEGMANATRILAAKKMAVPWSKLADCD